MKFARAVKHILSILFLVLFSIGCYPKSVAKNTIALPESGKKQAVQQPNNVLLISIDTLRADHLGCYGYQGIDTPHIDQLAEEGILFPSCYTTVPITLPSHSTLMTGQYPLMHGVRDNGTFRLDEESVTLAEIFKARGYQTAAFIGAFVLDSRFGLNQGFDVYNDRMDSNRETPEILYEEKRAGEVIEDALEWLTQPRETPFFLFIHCFDPHAPYNPPAQYKAQNQVCGQGGNSHVIPCYDGEIVYVDTCLGNLFQKMKELGVYDNTLICFTADHGESLSEHGEPSHGIFVYDSTLHIPLIIRSPHAVSGGKICQYQVNNTCIAPTILELSGIEQPNSPSAMQGRVLFSLSSEGTSFLLKSEIQSDEPLYCESYFPFYNHHWSPLEGVRTAEWKYIKAPKPELYHLTEDPQEIRNLYAQRKDQVRRMEKLFYKLKNTYSTDEDKFLKSKKISLDEDTRKRLESLGYVWTAPTEHYKEHKGDYPDPKDMVITLTFFNVAAYHYIRGEYDQALFHFQKCLEINPQDVFGHFMMGFIYQKIGEFEKAHNEFLECVRIDPAYVNGYVHLGGIYYKLGQLDTARQYLEKALQLDPDTIEAYRNLGVLYFSVHDYDKAIDAYEEALKRDPDCTDILYDLGNIYFAKKDYPSALRCFQKAVGLNPRYIDVHNGLANIYLVQGNIEEAKEHIEYALTLDSQKVDTHLNLAELYIYQNEYDLARHEIILAKESDPNIAKIYNCLGTIAIKESDYKKALPQFERALQLEPNSAEIYYNLGISYSNLNEIDRAIKAFEQSITLDPENSKAYFNLGIIFHRQHDISQAIEKYKSALALKPDNIEVLFQLGLANQEAGNIDQSVAIYKKIIARDEHHLKARIKLSLAYFAQGQIDPGISECKRILEIDPNNEAAHINLGLTFFKQKEFDQAIHEYQQAIQTNPTNSVTYFQIAYCYLWKKDTQKGIEYLKKALRINPDYQAARQLLNQIKSFRNQPRK